MRIELSHDEALAIVHEVFPNLSPEDADDLLWERTGWPIFFHSNMEGAEIRKNLLNFKRMLDAGKTPCDDCDNVAVVISGPKNYANVAQCKSCFLFSGGRNFLFHRIKTILTRRKKRV